MSENKQLSASDEANKRQMNSILDAVENWNASKTDLEKMLMLLMVETFSNTTVTRAKREYDATRLGGAMKEFDKSCAQLDLDGKAAKTVKSAFSKIHRQNVYRKFKIEVDTERAEAAKTRLAEMIGDSSLESLRRSVNGELE